MNAAQRLTRAILALALGSAIQACGVDPSPQDDPGAASADSAALGPAPSQRTSRFEVRFMTGMIDHHAMAIMTSEMCLEKAVHEELRALCEDIIAAQAAEIELMQSWLQDWYGVSYEPDMPMGGGMERLDRLSGAEFEIEFMEMMIRHHRQAVREGTMCVAKAYHPELIDVCEGIVATQTAEIRQMQDWLCEWYGICRDRGSPMMGPHR